MSRSFVEREPRVVYLASTLTAYLITLWTIRKELGARCALKIAGRQA